MGTAGGHILLSLLFSRLQHYYCRIDNTIILRFELRTLSTTTGSILPYPRTEQGIKNFFAGDFPYNDLLRAS